MVVTTTATVDNARVTELLKTSREGIEQCAPYPCGKVVHFPGLGAGVVVSLEYGIGNKGEGRLRLSDA